MISSTTMQLVVKAFSGKISPFSHACLDIMAVFFILSLIVCIVSIILNILDIYDIKKIKNPDLLIPLAGTVGTALVFELIAFFTR